MSKSLEQVLEELELLKDIPVNCDDEIEVPFLSYPVGVEKVEIWADFEEHCPKFSMWKYQQGLYNIKPKEELPKTFTKGLFKTQRVNHIDDLIFELQTLREKGLENNNSFEITTNLNKMIQDLRYQTELINKVLDSK